MHDVFPCAFWYSPSLQGAQVEAPADAKYVPAEQIEQVNASPEVIVLYPVEHLLQDV